MSCPFLKGNYLLSCRTNNRVYVPSQFELEEYCKTNRHTMCPFYKQQLGWRELIQQAGSRNYDSWTEDHSTHKVVVER